jgi:hypothetical protein
LVGHCDLELFGRLQVYSGRIDPDAGASDDPEPSTSRFHMRAGDLALAADHRVNAAGFNIPALRFHPGIHNHQIHALAQPLENLRLKLFD